MEIPIASGDEPFEVDLGDTNLGIFDEIMQRHDRYEVAANVANAKEDAARLACYAMAAVGFSPYDIAQYQDKGLVGPHFEKSPDQVRTAKNAQDLPPEADQWLGSIAAQNK